MSNIVEYIVTAEGFKHSFKVLVGFVGDLYRLFAGGVGDLHLLADYDGDMKLDLFGHTLLIDTGENLLSLGEHTMPISGDRKEVDLRILVDRCSFEVFADGGRYCATFCAVCDYNLPYLRLSADCPVKISRLSCHRLASVHEGIER